jgi:putative oxidoreductase
MSQPIDHRVKETFMKFKVQTSALLLGRVALGVVFAAHGWDKLMGVGLDDTAGFFDSVGVPAAQAAALAAAVVELVGGIAMMVGALLPVAGVLLAADMLGAIWFVHAEQGFWATDGGYEFVMVMAAASLALGFSGGGELSVDRLTAARRLRQSKA